MYYARARPQRPEPKRNPPPTHALGRTAPYHYHRPQNPMSAPIFLAAFALAAFLYALTRHLTERDTTNSPGFFATIAGVLTTAGLLLALLL